MVVNFKYLTKEGIETYEDFLTMLTEVNAVDMYTVTFEPGSGDALSTWLATLANRMGFTVHIDTAGHVSFAAAARQSLYPDVVIKPDSVTCDRFVLSVPSTPEARKLTVTVLSPSWCPDSLFAQWGLYELLMRLTPNVHSLCAKYKDADADDTFVVIDPQDDTAARIEAMQNSLRSGTARLSSFLNTE